MEIVFWICGLAALLMTFAYAAIGALMLIAKYRMTHVPARSSTARSSTTLSGPPIADLRYRT